MIILWELTEENYKLSLFTPPVFFTWRAPLVIGHPSTGALPTGMEIGCDDDGATQCAETATWHLFDDEMDAACWRESAL